MEKLYKNPIRDTKNLFKGEREAERYVKSQQEKINLQGNLLQQVSDAVISMDKDLNILTWNKSAEKIYGWSQKEVLSKSITKILKTRYLNNNQEDVLKEIENKGIWQGEVVQNIKNGQEINILVSASCSRNLKGDIVGYVSANRNITDFKQLQSYLKTSKERFEKSTELLPIILVENDKNNIITFMNGKGMKILGYSLDDIKRGLSIFQIIADEDVERIKIRHRERWKGKTFKPLEFNLKRKDGTVIHVLGSGTNVFDSNGNFICIRSVVVDISEAKKMENKLVKSEKLFRLLAENAKDLIYRYRLKPEKKFEYVSPSSILITGYAPKKFYTDPALYNKIIYSEDLHFLEEFEEGRTINSNSIVMRLMHKNGHVVWTEQKLTPIFKDNELIAVEGIIRDVTERIKDEERINHFNMLYSVVNQINKIIVKVKSRGNLFDEICRIAVKYGQFKMAWIGIIDEKTNMVVPVSFSGYENGYLSIVNIKLDNRERSKGPTGTAVKTGHYYICRDIEKDKIFITWREEALKRGYHSCAAFPICLKDKVIGALNLYASETGFFNEDEIELLQGVTNDISYALEMLNHQEKIKYQAHLLDQVSDAIISYNMDKKISSWNKAAERIYGWKEKEVLGKGTLELMKSKYLDGSREDSVKQLYDKNYWEGEILRRRKDGKRANIFTKRNLLKNIKGETIGIVTVDYDITEKKRIKKDLLTTERKLRSAFYQTIEIISGISEAKDPYTGGHQKRVSKLAMHIGKEIGLSENSIESLKMASILHDIGKISIPASILSKPGVLNEIEWKMLESHSMAGYEILKKYKLPWPIADIILQHHERIDGSGYPKKLKGNDIMIEARIIAVADVIEAMSSHRPYRPAHTIKKALEEIENNSGILYDQKIAEVALILFREKGFKF